MVNDHTNVSGNYIYPDITNIEQAYEDIVWHIEGFSGFAMLGVDAVVESARNKDITVVLNGQNGDETMFGYERYYAFYFFGLIKKLN